MDDRKVRITLLKLKVISDADKGSANKGEIQFEHWIGDQVLSGTGFHKIGSGATIDVRGSDGRPGVLGVVVANGSDPVFEMGNSVPSATGSSSRTAFSRAAGSPRAAAVKSAVDTSTAIGPLPAARSSSTHCSTAPAYQPRTAWIFRPVTTRTSRTRRRAITSSSVSTATSTCSSSSPS